MTKSKKIFQKALNNKKNIQFKEFEYLLNRFGFEKEKTKAGSQFKWFHKGKNIKFIFPRKNPVKSIYVKALIKIIHKHFI